MAPQSLPPPYEDGGFFHSCGQGIFMLPLLALDLPLFPANGGGRDQQYWNAF